MRKTSSFKRPLCLSAALACLIAGPALADPPPSANWNGLYAGGLIGGDWSDFDNHAGVDRSFMGGGFVGNNWQNDHMVLGLEGDFSKFNTHEGSGGVKFTEDWMSSLRARAGYAVDRFLPYVTGGLAMTDAVSKVSGVGSDERVQPGYTVGAGLDTMFADRWFGRIEYLYANVPKDSTTLGSTTVDGGSGNNIIRFGVGYKF